MDKREEIFQRIEEILKDNSRKFDEINNTFNKMQTLVNKKIKSTQNGLIIYVLVCLLLALFSILMIVLK